MNKATWLYIGLAYLITWTVTLASYFSYRAGTLTLDELNLVYNFGALGPFVAAFASAWIFYGANGVKRLSSTFKWRGLDKRALTLAFCPLAFFSLGWLLYPLFKGTLFTFAETQRQYGLSTPASYVGWILPFITYSVLEEFGWRGFLLPHLQDKYSALKATLLLTVFWSCWLLAPVEY